MIGKRLTERFDLVYIFDPALMAFTDEEIVNYCNKGRDLSLLDLNKCSEKPTIFSCDPLKTKYQYLLDNSESGIITLNTAWQIFKTHVKAAKRFDDDKGAPLLEWTDSANPIIKDECQDRVPTDVVMDIAATIVKKAGDLTANPMLPGTFWATRARSRLLHANDAKTETAKDLAETLQ